MALGKLPKGSTCKFQKVVRSVALGKNVHRCGKFTTPSERRRRRTVGKGKRRSNR
jgi:hypothetical protein